MLLTQQYIIVAHQHNNIFEEIFNSFFTSQCTVCFLPMTYSQYR